MLNSRSTRNNTSSVRAVAREKYFQSPQVSKDNMNNLINEQQMQNMRNLTKTDLKKEIFKINEAEIVIDINNIDS